MHMEVHREIPGNFSAYTLQSGIEGGGNKWGGGLEKVWN